MGTENRKIVGKLQTDLQVANGKVKTLMTSTQELTKALNEIRKDNERYKLEIEAYESRLDILYRKQESQARRMTNLENENLILTNENLFLKRREEGESEINTLLVEKVKELEK